ncbi:MAG: hypothetical protein AB7O39_03165 [Flavobacteriaceae bacterium]
MTAIIGNRFKLAEYVRNTWHVTPKPEDEPKDLLDPKWWVHVSQNLKAGDRIEAFAETREWYAEGVVLDAGVWGAKIALTLGPVKLANDAVVEAPEEYAVQWGGPSAKWRVVRVADKTVLRDQLGSKEEAASYIKSHRKAMAA